MKQKIAPLFFSLFFLFPLSVFAKQAQNQIQVQNAGQDKKIEIQNMEVLESGTSSVQQHMSQVAVEVQKLLESSPSGGIGQQVRVVAQAQNQNQIAIKTGLDKISSSSAFVKKLFGYSRKNIQNLEKVMTANRLQIEQLQRLQLEISNQADADQVQSLIQTLEAQQTNLAQTVQAEKQNLGLFGWLTRFFVKSEDSNL